MNNKLYISGLSIITDESILKEGFSPFGLIKEIKIIYDRSTGYSKGFAFITFSTEEEALLAEKMMNERNFDGRVLKVSIAKDHIIKN
jgi:RNA recognition motif-containing protein